MKAKRLSFICKIFFIGFLLLCLLNLTNVNIFIISYKKYKKNFKFILGLEKRIKIN